MKLNSNLPKNLLDVLSTDSPKIVDALKNPENQGFDVNTPIGSERVNNREIEISLLEYAIENDDTETIDYILTNYADKINITGRLMHRLLTQAEMNENLTPLLQKALEEKKAQLDKIEDPQEKVKQEAKFINTIGQDVRSVGQDARNDPEESRHQYYTLIHRIVALASTSETPGYEGIAHYILDNYPSVNVDHWNYSDPQGSAFIYTIAWRQDGLFNKMLKKHVEAHKKCTQEIEFPVPPRHGASPQQIEQYQTDIDAHVKKLEKIIKEPEKYNGKDAASVMAYSLSLERYNSFKDLLARYKALDSRFLPIQDKKRAKILRGMANITRLIKYGELDMNVRFSEAYIRDHMDRSGAMLSTEDLAARFYNAGHNYLNIALLNGNVAAATEFIKLGFDFTLTDGAELDNCVKLFRLKYSKNPIAKNFPNIINHIDHFRQGTLFGGTSATAEYVAKGGLINQLYLDQLFLAQVDRIYGSARSSANNCGIWLAKGANVNVADETTGNTALHVLARSYNNRIPANTLRALMVYVDEDAKHKSNNNKRTPIDILCLNHHASLTEMEAHIIKTNASYSRNTATFNEEYIKNYKNIIDNLKYFIDTMQLLSLPQEVSKENLNIICDEIILGLFLHKQLEKGVDISKTDIETLRQQSKDAWQNPEQRKALLNIALMPENIFLLAPLLRTRPQEVEQYIDKHKLFKLTLERYLEEINRDEETIGTKAHSHSYHKDLLKLLMQDLSPEQMNSLAPDKSFMKTLDKAAGFLILKQNAAIGNDNIGAINIGKEALDLLDIQAAFLMKTTDKSTIKSYFYDTQIALIRLELAKRGEKYESMSASEVNRFMPTIKMWELAKKYGNNNIVAFLEKHYSFALEESIQYDPTVSNDLQTPLGLEDKSSITGDERSTITNNSYTRSAVGVNTTTKKTQSSVNSEHSKKPVLANETAKDKTLGEQLWEGLKSFGKLIAKAFQKAWQFLTCMSNTKNDHSSLHQDSPYTNSAPKNKALQQAFSPTLSPDNLVRKDKARE